VKINVLSYCLIVEKAGEGFGQVQSVSSQKMRTDAFPYLKPPPKLNLATTKTHVGLGIK
jgi:hypothetical protein